MNRHQIMLDVAKILESAGIEFLVIGATARDILAERFSVELSERRTEDVDFAILLENWDMARGLREFLLKNPDITAPENPEDKVRYFYKGAPFDIVPFGGVENEKHTVSWPPHHDAAMVVLGYREAFQDAIVIKYGDQSVRVLSVEFFVALKLVAWGFNGQRERDVSDIGYILTNYDKFGVNPYEYLLDHEEGLDLLELVNHDHANAEVCALGLRMREKLKVETKKRLLDNLGSDSQVKMVDAILRSTGPKDEDLRNREDRKWRGMLNALFLGMAK